MEQEMRDVMKMTYGINENPAAERDLDVALVAVMEAASVELRAKEAEETNRLIERFDSYARFCNDFRESHGYNPGGWVPLLNAQDDLAQIAIRAVSAEQSAMFKVQWLDGAWRSKDWMKETLAALEAEKEFNHSYYSSRFERWERWKKEGGDPGRLIEGKKMNYVEKRGNFIQNEMDVIKQLGEFATELRKGKLPAPSSNCNEANQYLALLYKQRLERPQLCS
jgi:hypothetical protein